jgi:hypothetical protein
LPQGRRHAFVDVEINISGSSDAEELKNLMAARSAA